MTSHTTNHKQEGLASIVITLFVLIILSMTIIAFSQAARREQRQALDRQLSTQAQYAAESGINAAIALLKTSPNASNSSCSNTSTILGSSDLDASSNIQYPCVLINQKPTSLQYTIAKGKEQIVPLNASGVNISSVSVSWQSVSTNSDASFTACPTPGEFASDWPASNCDASVMRIELVPVGGASLSRTNLIDNDMALFAHPSSATGTTVLSGATYRYGSGVTPSYGGVEAIRCSYGTTPYACKATINLPTPVGSSNNSIVYMRLRSVYADSKVEITALNASSVALPITGSQIVIDSTGKANDVLRRIAVRIPALNRANVYPDYGLWAENLCKRFGYVPGETPTPDISDNYCSLTPSP